MTPDPRPLRICITGSECAGKTTLARALASALGTLWVPEFSRIFAETCGHPLGPRDIQPIAEGQLAAQREGEHRATGQPVVIFDTDLISTVVYGYFYNGGCPGWIEHAARAERADLYLYCACADIAWQDDGIRGKAGGRDMLDTMFREALARYDAHVVPICGDLAARLTAGLDLLKGELL